VPTLFDFELLWRGRITVALNGHPVQTLSAEDTVLYLLWACFRNQWTSLGWLCDLTHVIRGAGEIQWSEIAARSAAHGFTRVLGLAMTLAAGLFDAPVPRELACASPAAEKIAALAFAENSGEEPIWAMRRAQSKLLGTARDKARFWADLFFCPTHEEWIMMPAQKGWFWVYYALRPARLVGKYVLRWGKGDGGTGPITPLTSCLTPGVHFAGGKERLGGGGGTGPAGFKA
jgi:hypothetical protein